MKKLAAVCLLLLPVGVLADHIDVIEVQLNEGCTLQQYIAIKDDFNSQWGSKNAYRSEVLVAIQSNNLTSIYWVGRTSDAAAFGKAWDQWRNDLGNPDSVAARLWARFVECSTNVSRRGYDVY